MDRRKAITHMATLTAGAIALPVLLRGATDANASPGARPLPHIGFHNVESIEPLKDEGWRLSRVPAALWTKLNSSAKVRAYAPAGAELRFNLQQGAARVFLRYVENRGEHVRGLPVLAEIYHGDFLADWIRVGSDWTEVVIRNPGNDAAIKAASVGQPARFAPDLIRVVLPYLPDVQLLRIEGEVAPPRPDQVPARRYLAYGSSITHGAFAVRPGDLYPARVARALGFDHFNLGFASGAHLEPEMAEWIASRRDWDIATLELGINLVSTLSPEQFADRVDGFLPRIVAAHPDDWIFCIDLFTARGDFSADPKYPLFRTIVREAVKKLGSPKVVHCDGRQLLTRHSGLTLDLTHPSSEGFEEIAARLQQVMRVSAGLVASPLSPQVAE